MIDYLFLDYLIVLARDSNWYINQMLNSIPSNNLECDELQKVLNTKFDEDDWRQMSSETHLFKLSWKCDYMFEKDGKETYFKKLMINEL